MKWRYWTRYRITSNDDDVTELNQDWQDGGILEYIPAERKAIVYGKDGEIVDTSKQLNAGELHYGAMINLSRVMLELVSDILQGEVKPGTYTPPTIQPKSLPMNGRIKRSAMVAKPVIKNATIAKPVDNVAMTIEPVASPEKIWYEILWTKQVSKKIKIWNEGWVEFSANYDRLGQFYKDDGGLLFRKKYRGDEAFPSEGECLQTSMMLIEISAPLEAPKIKKKKSDTTESALEESKKDKDEDCGNVTTTKGESGEYEMLYTTDKHKKLKKWIDGTLRWNAEKMRAEFFDEEGNRMFERLVKSEELLEGNEINTAKYIFQLGCRKGDYNNPIAVDLSIVKPPPSRRPRFVKNNKSDDFSIPINSIEGEDKKGTDRFLTRKPYSTPNVVDDQDSSALYSSAKIEKVNNNNNNEQSAGAIKGRSNSDLLKLLRKP